MEMNSLQAPLISNRDPEDNDAGHEDDVDSDTGVPHRNGPNVETSPGLFMWLLTLSAGISGLLFGCTSATHICSSSAFRRVTRACSC